MQAMKSRIANALRLAALGLMTATASAADDKPLTLDYQNPLWDGALAATTLAADSVELTLATPSLATLEGVHLGVTPDNNADWPAVPYAAKVVLAHDEVPPV